MKHSHTILVSTILMLMLLLSACGGDNPTSGRGGGPPPQTVFQERTDRILALNPTLLASDTLERTVLDGSSQPSTRTAPFTCRAGRCVHPFFEGDYSIAETFDAELIEELGTHRGVLVGSFQKAEPETEETYGYERLSLGGWLHQSTFGLSVIAISTTLGDRSLFSFSMGSPSGTNPRLGSATWIGGMLGIEVPTVAIGDIYGGDATVTVDLDDATASVLFNNILENGEVPYPDMSWNDVPLVGGTFRRDTRREEVITILPRLEGSLIEGRFYGATHAEVGGIFETPEMLGAFGASR